MNVSYCDGLCYFRISVLICESVFSVYAGMSPYDLLARKMVTELDAVVLSVE